MISEDLALRKKDRSSALWPEYNDNMWDGGKKKWGLKEKRTETNVIQMKQKHQPDGSLKDDQLKIIQILQQEPAIDPKVQTFQ